MQVYSEFGSLVFEGQSWKKSQFVGRKSQLVVLNRIVTNACCGLAVIFCALISLLIGRETINIPEIFSGVHSVMGETVN